MSIVKYQPFRSFTDRFFEDDFFNHFRNNTTYRIPVDIYEKKDKIHLDFELPGISKKNIEIQLENSTLTVKGTFEKDKDIQEENYFRTERYYGEFSRSFTIPNNIAHKDISANFDKGILKVTFPKSKETEEVKKIEIK
ncbi:MAG: Hsp20/alpha crystallin family protein [Candidatus Cloacimonadota bacterium]|nr:Hsp20/alpha crystallin family protein [Candidatus Cloacimonadota bacterium]